MYQKFFKRVLDILCATLALVALCWVYFLIAILVKIKLGGPVLFKQPRPGKKGKDGKEKIFCLYKFRTMTNEKDENGKLLPDSERITPFGRKLRAWSLDEIPEAINILKGDMSVIGPRPQLVRDLVFMTDEQRQRHNVRPGLSGLAQVKGRNAIQWDHKFECDNEYIQNITFIGDFKITVDTVRKVFLREGITAEGQATVDDYGVELLKAGKITQEEFDRKQKEAEVMLKEAGFGE